MNARQKYTIVNNRIAYRKNGKEVKGKELAIQHANLENRNLRGVNLDNLDLRNVNLKGATLCNASVENTIFFNELDVNCSLTTHRTTYKDLVKLYNAEMYRPEDTSLKGALVDPSMLANLSFNQIYKCKVEVENPARESFASKYTIISAVCNAYLNADIKSEILSLACHLYKYPLTTINWTANSDVYILEDLKNVLEICTNERFWQENADCSSSYKPNAINEIIKLDKYGICKATRLVESDFTKWKKIKEIANSAEINCPSLIALSFYKAINTNKVEKFSIDYSSKLTPANPGII